MSIALTIKEIAKNKNLSLKNLALEIGISEAGFHKKLKSDNFWNNDLLKIAKVLDVPLETLLSLSLDDLLSPNTRINELEKENLRLENRIKLIEEQLDDKRKLISYYEQQINSLTEVLPKAIYNQFQISNLWEYYLNEADIEFPLFKKLMFTPLNERGKTFEKEYQDAKIISRSIFKKKFLNDPEIKKYINSGFTFKDLLRIFIETEY